MTKGRTSRPKDEHMGGFAQFGLNRFKLGQKLDNEKLKSCSFVCSSTTARRGFDKVVCRDCDM